jgi:hypothetical protein
MDKMGIQILKATVGIRSNAQALLPRFPQKIEVKSLLTDFTKMFEISYSGKLDGHIVLENTHAARATFEFSKSTALFRGPLLKLEGGASDLRFSLWGNQGFLYRLILFLLEKKHRIFSLHACGLFDEKKNFLYVIAGGAGSGKTVYLLSGIAKGLKLFSSESVHFKIEGNDITWFKGSLVDNVRLGTLVHDFPQFLTRLDRGRKASAVWRKKIALDLSAYQCLRDTLNRPRVMILFPRIEQGRLGFISAAFDDNRTAAKAIFDNLSQKIAETVVLDDRLTICGLDDPALAQARLATAYRLVEHHSIVKMASVLSNPAECWGHLLDGIGRRRS